MSALDSQIETANSSNYNIAIMNTNWESDLETLIKRGLKGWKGTLKSFEGKLQQKIQQSIESYKNRQRTHSSMGPQKRKPKKYVSLTYSTPIKEKLYELYHSPPLQQLLNEINRPKHGNGRKGTPINPKNYAQARLRSNTWFSPYSKPNHRTNSKLNAASIARNRSHPKKRGSKKDVWNRLPQPKIQQLFDQYSINQKKIGPKSYESKSLSKPIAVGYSKKSKK